MPTATETTGIELAIDGPIATITLNRPAVRNALDLTAARALLEATERIDADPDILVGILTGEGPAFCAGADLQARRRGEPRAVIEPYGFGGFARKPRATPFIAAVNGYAVGGGFELAFACDVVVAAENAHFSVPEVARGLIAAGDCLPFLASALPPKIAAEMAITGRRMSAAEAQRWGLINDVDPDALACAREHAQKILGNAPLAVKATRELLGALPSAAPAGYYALADALQRQLLATDDAAEAAEAFSKKRTPQWTGQ